MEWVSKTTIDNNNDVLGQVENFITVKRKTIAEHHFLYR